MPGRMIIPVVLSKSRNRRAILRNRRAFPDDDFESASREFERERRTFRRFPIELPGVVSTRKICIHGTTVNVSSGGLLMACSGCMLKVGEHVRVRLTNWPSARHDANLALIIAGVVVRSWDGYIAVRRKWYAFVEA